MDATNDMSANAMPPSEGPRGRAPGASRIPLGARSGRLNPFYGRLVSALKVLLPTVALAMVGVIMMWPNISDEVASLGVKLIGLSEDAADSMQLSNARYTGVDDQDQPYTITAEAVSQGTLDAPEVTLVRPKADIMLEDESWAALTANDGVFVRAAKRLTLTGDVSFFHDQGYEFMTNSATLDIATGEAVGSDPVSGQGPFGNIEAEGFQVFDRGARVLLTGRSKVEIYTGDNADRGASAPATE